MAHLHRWALACLGVWVGRLLQAARPESAPRQPVRLADRLASLQGPSEPCARRPLCGFLPWCASNSGNLSMQLSFLPVAYPQAGLRRSWHGTLAALPRSLHGPMAVPVRRKPATKTHPCWRAAPYRDASLLHPVRRLACLADGHGRSPGSAAPWSSEGCGGLRHASSLGVASEQGAAGDTNVGVRPC